MNALQQAQASTSELTNLLALTTQARAAFAARRATQGQRQGSTQIVLGKGMVRVIDSTSGRCLGFRQSYREAQWLQQSLENGTYTPAPRHA